MHAPAASGGRAAPSDFRLGPDCMICIRSPMPLVCCFGSPAANAPRGEARATARVLRGVVSIGHLAWTVTALGRAPRPDLGRRPSLFLQKDSEEGPESVAHVGQEEVRKQRLHHRGCHLLSVGERRCVGQRPHHRSDASRPHSTCFSRDLRMPRARASDKAKKLTSSIYQNARLISGMDMDFVLLPSRSPAGRRGPRIKTQ
jgi:hypothetical protein